jgi:hypothetical protein
MALQQYLKNPYTKVYFRIDIIYYCGASRFGIAPIRHFYRCFLYRFFGRNNMSKFSAYKPNRNNPNNGSAVFFRLFSVPLASLAQPQDAQDSTLQSCYLDRIEGSSGYGKSFNWQCMPEIFST